MIPFVSDSLEKPTLYGEKSDQFLPGTGGRGRSMIVWGGRGSFLIMTVVIKLYKVVKIHKSVHLKKGELYGM